MKKIRKLLSLVLAMIMAFAMTGQAFADETPTTYTITINNTVSGHVYEAYQIFAGDLDTTEKILSNIQWGSGVNDAAEVGGQTLIQAINAITYNESQIFSECETAREVAEKLADYASNHEVVNIFADVISKYLSETGKASSTEVKAGDVTTKYTISGLYAGYYLVKEAINSDVGTGDAYTEFILEVVKDVEVDPKSSVPTVTKKVKENSDGVYYDVADYNIGENVAFKLTGTMPDRLGDYSTYKYVFHDTLADGFTRNNDVKVYVGEDESTRVDVTNNFTISPVDSDGKFTISIDDVKNITGVTITKDSKIVVEYTAKLTSKAVLGIDGTNSTNANTNEVYLEYSNNPNAAGTGNTTTDKVVVFTYELDVIKVAKESFVESTGEYTKKLENAKFKLYKKVSDNGQTSNMYAVLTNDIISGWTAEETNATVLSSNANGKIEVKGLDAGEYYLKETSAPDGYNLLSSDVKVEIGATKGEVNNWGGTVSNALTAITVSVDNGNAEDGTVSGGVVTINVENSAGATLPSTGGIGTTVFYAVGIILMAGAVFFVVRRKRA